MDFSVENQHRICSCEPVESCLNSSGLVSASCLRTTIMFATEPKRWVSHQKCPAMQQYMNTVASHVMLCVLCVDDGDTRLHRSSRNKWVGIRCRATRICFPPNYLCMEHARSHAVLYVLNFLLCAIHPMLQLSGASTVFCFEIISQRETWVYGLGVDKIINRNNDKPA